MCTGLVATGLWIIALGIKVYGVQGSGFRVREFGFGLGFGVLSGFLTPKYLRKPLLT